MAASGTTGSHSTSSRVIRPFLAQPLDVIRSNRSSYSSNNVYLPTEPLRSAETHFWEFANINEPKQPLLSYTDCVYNLDAADDWI